MRWSLRRRVAFGAFLLLLIYFWVVGVGLPGPNGRAFQPLSRLGLVALGVAAQLALLLYTFLLLKAFLRPFAPLIQAMRELSAGVPRRRVRAIAFAEAEELVRTFNETAFALDEQTQAAHANEATLRAALTHMADGVVVLDTFARVLLLNNVAEATFGRSAEQSEGRTLLDTVMNSELDALTTRVLHTGVQESAEIETRQPSPRSLRVYITPVHGERETPVRAVMVFQDLTEIRKLERVRRDFVANASHELKTPLATMSVMVANLQRGIDTESDASPRFLDTLGHEVKRLGALVDDLLELSRIESPSERLPRDLISLSAMVRSLAEVFHPAAEQRDQTLDTDTCDDALVWGDGEALRRMGANLVENALKYTPDGGTIHVECGVREHVCYFRVTDTGLGIPADDLTRIFERFYRVDKARSRATGGTGLGLSIVKHIVDSHEGRVEVESQVNKGSVFTIWLPLLHVPAQEELFSTPR